MTRFRSLYHQGFARIAACTLPVSLAEPYANAERVLEVLKECDRQRVATVVFPELGLTGYTLDDLRFQDVVLDGARTALEWLARQTADLMSVAVVGLPLCRGSCSIIVQQSFIVGVFWVWFPNPIFHDTGNSMSPDSSHLAWERPDWCGLEALRFRLARTFCLKHMICRV